MGNLLGLKAQFIFIFFKKNQISIEKWEIHENVCVLQMRQRRASFYTTTPLLISIILVLGSWLFGLWISVSGFSVGCILLYCVTYRENVGGHRVGESINYVSDGSLPSPRTHRLTHYKKTKLHCSCCVRASYSARQTVSSSVLHSQHCGQCTAHT